MKTLKLFAIPLLLAGTLIIGISQTASPAGAQNLEDALRRSERPNNGDNGRGSSTVPPQSAPPTPSYGNQTSPSRPSRRRWGALAAGLWKRNGIAQVAVGSAIKFRTKQAAINAALRQCRSANGRNCKIASTWSRGCGYITTGRNSKGAGWVARASLRKTMRDCRAKNYRCKPAIGGCVN